ncbi:Non-specific serine/threonine protein kinase protein [Dioscorea alata]|uniref:Non-specific serine/threonine protein kinase protein n=1 Tax=Dioscorea alata TaxID=55571 RepID=A0ACB7UNX0_DIOAL|nr:Non-specific serine/threonine protein kinase protein [Dioscorea alata]
MPFLTEALLFLLLSLQLVCPALSDTVYQSCETDNYTTNNTYQSNLLTILPSLSSNGSKSGFSENTVGTVPNRIYGLVLCRGDVNATDCRNCLNVATQDVIQICSNKKGGLVWYDPCFLRYSNQDFLSSTDDYNPVILINTQSVAEPDKFNKLVVELMNMTAQFASYNTSRRFATGEANFTVSNPKIYGLTQCTPDLTGDQCYRCLQGAFNVISGYADKKGLRIIGVRCNFRYEVYSFFEGKSMVLLSQSNGTNTTPTPTPTATPTPTPTPTVEEEDLTNSEQMTSVESILFDLSVLKDATADFSELNKLGQGGFGSVFKGTLSDGREIAVKRLSAGSGQGIEELKNELVLVAKLQHRNLVRLLGVCLEEREKMLVYEYVPNKSLDTILFDSVKRKQLDWGRRYKIISGIARGLLYLHEDSQLKIIHRDLKASNILLDEEMNPKISDFGMARLFECDQTGGTTSRVVGTFGYMAPEYVIRGQYSAKSDIFSYGVLVLEILTGRKNSDLLENEQAEDLLSYTWEHWTRGTISEILDPSLRDQWPRSEALRCIQIGLLCVQEDPANRPTMSMVVLMLNSYSVSLQTPSRPAFCVGLSGGMDSDAFQKGTNVSTDRFGGSVPMTPNEVSISEMEPR